MFFIDFEPVFLKRDNREAKKIVQLFFELVGLSKELRACSEYRRTFDLCTVPECVVRHAEFEYFRV